jgi:hypothetical protein
MTAYNIGEEVKKNVRTAWCANGIYAANMMDIDIDAVGIPGPEGHLMRPVEQRERKGLRISDRRRRKAKSQKFVQTRGPRWDLNPCGYEQGIGPDHLRKGRHEPPSCACDRGHGGYKHWAKKEESWRDAAGGL